MIIIGVILIVVLVIGVFLLVRGFKMTNVDLPDIENIDYVQDTQDILNDFQIDLVYHTDTGREIHYSAYIPSNIDELDSVSLFITLPGWEGLYFQGVGVNLESEDFAYTAKDLNPNMIILAPQLNDWQEQSAIDTILLTEYYQELYPVSYTAIEGYSGGGETLSLVLNTHANLYDKALMVSSEWNGIYDNVIENRLPLYFFIGEDDDYYGSDNFKESYQEIHDRYIEEGLSEEEIDGILILDVRDRNYFHEHGLSSEHAGGGFVAHESDIMKWLLNVN